MRVVTFKIEETLLEQIDAYAIKHRMYRSEVIRRAIECYLQDEKKEEKGEFQIKIEKMRL